MIYNTSFFKSLATGGNVSRALVRVRNYSFCCTNIIQNTGAYRLIVLKLEQVDSTTWHYVIFQGKQLCHLCVCLSIRKGSILKEKNLLL